MIVITSEETKSPTGVKDIVLNWVDWLGTDQISSSAWAVLPTGGVTVDSTANTTTTATAIVSAGTHNRKVFLKNTIVTTGGRTETRWIQLTIFNG